MNSFRPLRLVSVVLLGAALLVLGLAGCAGTRDTGARPEVAAARGDRDMTLNTVVFRSYLEGQGHALRPDGSFDSAILSVDSEGYSVDGDRGALRVYQFDSAGAMALALREIEDDLPFSAEWSVYRGGNLVAVYVGGDADVIAALDGVMEPVE